jgi:putative intracellular protease/amidase
VREDLVRSPWTELTFFHNPNDSDLPSNTHSHALISAFYAAGKPFAFVCHSPVALVDVKVTKTGEKLVKGQKVRSFMFCLLPLHYMLVCAQALFDTPFSYSTWH